MEKERKKKHQSICVDCALICKFIVIEMMKDERKSITGDLSGENGVEFVLIS